MSDRAAFAALYASHARRVYGYVRRRVLNLAVAEDLAAETWLRAWQYWPTYTDRGVPVQGWLLRIAENLVRDHQRRWTLHPMVELPPTLALPDPAPGPEALAVAREAHAARVAQVRALLAALTPAQRAALTVRYGPQGPGTTEEIAARLGCSPGAAKMLVHRARGAARRALARQEDAA